MTAQEIVTLIRKNFPNASEVVLNEIASRLHNHENYVFQKVFKEAFESGKDLGLRIGKEEGRVTERLNWLGWENE